MKKVKPTDVGYIGLATITKNRRVVGFIRNRFHLTGKELTLVLRAQKKERDTWFARERNKQVDECYRHLLKWLDKNGFVVFMSGKVPPSARNDMRKFRLHRR